MYCSITEKTQGGRAEGFTDAFLTLQGINPILCTKIHVSIYSLQKYVTCTSFLYIIGKEIVPLLKAQTFLFVVIITQLPSPVSSFQELYKYLS
jgi:hypothetical protein